MGLGQYEIVVVNLDPTVGSEIQKTRPCVVVSPVELNRNLNTVVVAPMTTNLKNYPTRVRVNFQGKEGRIAVDQIRTVDSKRIIKALGKINNSEITELKRTIQETFVE